jgi:hypothetical protein
MIIFFVKDMAYFQQENKICIAVSILILVYLAIESFNFYLSQPYRVSQSYRVSIFILVYLAIEWLLGGRNEQILSLFQSLF